MRIQGVWEDPGWGFGVKMRDLGIQRRNGGVKKRFKGSEEETWGLGGSRVGFWGENEQFGDTWGGLGC